MKQNQYHYLSYAFLLFLIAVSAYAVLLPPLTALLVVFTASVLCIWGWLWKNPFARRYVDVQKKMEFALGAASMGIWEWEIPGGNLRWTPSLELVHGLEPGSFGGRFEDFKRLIHPEDRDYVMNEINRAVETKSPYAVEYRIQRPDGAVLWIEARGQIKCDKKGNPSEMMGIGIDITARKNLEESIQFLSLAGREFTLSMDSHAFLKKMAECAVPRFADCCAVDLVDSASGKYHRVALIHRDRTKTNLAWQIYHRYEESCTGENLISRVIREKKPLIGRMTPQLLDELCPDEEYKQLCAQLQFNSFMVIPLLTRHGLAGVISFFSAESRRNYTSRDLSFAEHLAGHAGLAIENAWHYQDLAETRRDLEKKVQERTALAENRAMKLRELTLMLTRSEQDERRRIAVVLHDDLQQLLVAAKIGIHQLRNHAEDEVRDISMRVEQLLVDSVNVSRSLTVELSPHVLRDGNLRQVMEWLTRWFNEKYGLEVEIIDHDGAVDVPEESRIFLFQSVRELLLNVVKHAKVKRARLVIAACVNGGIVVSVIDDGQGFQRTGQEEESGSVFGLFNIKERLEMLGGRLEIDSTRGRGSRVTLWISPDSFKKSEIESHPEAGDESSFKEYDSRDGKRILVVDDHKIVRQGIVNLLSSHTDFSVAGEAGDGMSAVEQAMKLQPDVIVMDISMPRMNGIDATTRIKAVLPWVKIITLSLHDSEDMEERARQCGSDAYLNKSGPADRLVETIRGLFTKDGHSDLANSIA